MKKVFLLIFCGLLFGISSVSAEVFSIVDTHSYKPHGSKSPAEAITPDLPDPNDQEAVRKFFKERIEHAAVTKAAPDDDYTTPSSINVVHTPEYYKAKEEENKPLFQKMYENAVQALYEKENENSNVSAENEISEEEAAETATRFFTINAPKKPRIEDNYANEPSIPTVGFSLPSGRRMLAPALEHIPYFLSYIDIQANGYLKIEDTIIVVADGKKFAHPIERIFTKYVQNENRHRQKIDVVLTDVSVNGTPISYTIEEIGNNIVLKPKYKQTLEPGVYTYTFNYLVNYGLQTYENNVIMNWLLTGKPLNAFVTSANAIITLPTGKTFKNVQSIIGRNNKYTAQRSNIIPLAANAVAISNYTPLLNGETMNLIAIADKSAFLANFDNNFNRFIFNWGNIVYAAFGLLTILFAYLLSLINLKHEKRNVKYTPSHNGSLMRQILVGKCDRIAFVAQILDLFRKQALDITEENNCVYLTRKNINNSRLNKTEKQILKKLFTKKTNRFAVNLTNSEILKKINYLLAKNNQRQIKKYSFMHNMVYIIFSCTMLLLTEIFIAAINVNPLQIAIVLILSTAVYAFYIWILRYKFKHWYVSVPLKIFSLLAILVVLMFSSLYNGFFTGILILAMIFTIFSFTKIFAKQNNFIVEANKSIQAYKEYLLLNSGAINLGRDLISNQSCIYALGIKDYFPLTVTNKQFYRLDIAERLHQSIVKIL